MFLRIRLLQPLFLYDFIRDRLDENPSVSFTYKHYSVTATIIGGQVLEAIWAEPDDKCRWYRPATEIEILIKETEKSRHPIHQLLTPELHQDLVELLEGAALHLFRAIRNIGISPELPETLPRQKTTEEELRTWDPEVSKDGSIWTPFFAPDPPPGPIFLKLFGLKKQGLATNAELDVGTWDKIQEVLEDGLEIQPEDEFLTNTIGHLRGRNYRLAVIDAIIGLEIVLTRYLTAYLSVIKQMLGKRIDDFLRYDFGLTARLSGILNLTVHESYLTQVKMEHVLQAVTWRNKIVHKTGRLPLGVPTEKINEVVGSVLVLARILANQYIDVRAEADRNTIAKDIKAKWTDKIFWPRIWFKRWHAVSVEIECLYDHALSRVEMRKIAKDFTAHLKPRDPRFNYQTHLHIAYYTTIPNRKRVGQFIFGKIRLEGESLLDTPREDDMSEL